MLVAYGVRRDGRRELLAFWIVTDGCPGLAAAIQTVYAHVPHQRCWVHKMRNIPEHVRKRDVASVKREAQAIYGAENRREAERAFQVSRAH